ncbi:MAG: hypothetical protein ACTSQA_07665 [Candidatus Heimdallarchaeaceae archaeon]
MRGVSAQATTPPAGTEGGASTLSLISPANTQELMRMQTLTAGIAEKSQNVVKSFWSVWSISWMIRGTLQNIFGYSTKWVREVNKLTRAFQAGLYMYAGMAKIIDGVTSKILVSNAAYQHSLGAQKTIAYVIKPAIAKLENRISLNKKQNLIFDKKELQKMH